MNLLEDETAIVTGGASGIGRGISQEFARNGADVVIADVRSTPRLRTDARPTHEWIEDETDSEAVYVECDVSDPDAVQALVDATVERFGTIDALVNNAGIAIEDDYGVSSEKFDEFMSVNVGGCFYPSRAVAERMIDDGVEGSIVMVSSTEGVRTPDARPIYGASRGAVRCLAYALAGRLGSHGIRVNVVMPGLFESAMVTEDIPIFENLEGIKERIPLERAGELVEIGKAATFFASDMSSYVTGGELLVDGGITNVSR